MTRRLFIATDVTQPEDVRQYLADPALHWKKGFSACKLATSWVISSDFPASVRGVLDSHPVFTDARLIEAFFEKKVYLETTGRPSQNDILVYAKLKEGYAAIAVEGKVREGFDRPVSVKEQSPGFVFRVQNLCHRLGLRVDDVQTIHYQLLHRTVSAILEAERYCAENALMLVHSFDPGNASFEDYRKFAHLLGFPMNEVAPNRIAGNKLLGGVKVYLGWVSDCPSQTSEMVLPTSVPVIIPKVIPSEPVHSVINEQALRNLIVNIKRSGHRGEKKSTSTLSSNISSGYKARTGQDYKAIYGDHIRSQIASLGVSMGVPVEMLVDLVVAMKGEPLHNKYDIINEIREAMQG